MGGYGPRATRAMTLGVAQSAPIPFVFSMSNGYFEALALVIVLTCDQSAMTQNNSTAVPHLTRETQMEQKLAYERAGACSCLASGARRASADPLSNGRMTERGP